MATVTNVIENNETVQTLLENTIEKIKEHNSKSGIAAGVGLASTVGGLGLVVTGLALIPVTFGGSVGLSVIGGGLATAGVATGLATLAVESVLCDKEIEEGQQAIDRYVKYRNQLSGKVKQITFPFKYRKMSITKIKDEILPFLRKENENLRNM